ncbi:energy transducer TonB [Phenylobacterium sp.]|jgi:TonB family protein|uniref:energy transducer TonB family protein n=1 Tax=Phenylobacterium sp. TaxID=1871053 RepID=UPI002F427964
MPLILMLAALAAQPPNTVSPVVVTGVTAPATTVRMDGKDPASRAIMDAWPSPAYDSTQDGRVVLSCRVDRHGLAEWCEVASESPKGAGFGELALQMRMLLKVTPPRGPDGPIMATMPLAVEFKSTDEHPSTQAYRPHDALQPDSVNIWNDPVWAQAPRFEDLARVYPAGGRGVEGYVVLHCLTGASGGLSDCTILKETPIGHGFGRAALRLKPKFLVDTRREPPHRRTLLWVDIPIRFPPASQIDRVVDAPIWVAGFDARSAIKLFPPEAAAEKVTSGRGVARCQIASDGSLRACRPTGEEPSGLGFSEAAAKLAGTLRANLWSLDGAPVSDGEVEVAIRLNLKPPS